MTSLARRALRRAHAVTLSAVFFLLLSGCSAEIYHDLEEQSANEMIVALEHHGITAEKIPDVNAEGRWMLQVSTADRVDAWKVLQAQGLPKPQVKGFDAHYPSSGLIPTSSEERILLQFSTSQELRRTLLTVDRVVDAQVNLVLPEKPRVPMPNQVVEKPRASVLIKYRPTEAIKTPPLTDEQVSTLVAGGVEALEAAQVKVIQTPEAIVPRDQIVSPRFAQVGPISVAPQSKTWMQIILGMMSMAVVLMGATIAFLLIRRVRSATPDA